MLTTFIMEMMERNRKLRLLVTTDCPNHCPMCCNNQFDFDKLKRVEHFDYDEIMITGGEPLLFPNKVAELARAIKTTNSILYPQEKTPKIYVYTSVASYLPIKHVLNAADGIVLTPHSQEDVRKFLNLNRVMGVYLRINKTHPSLRLNLFKNIKAMLPEDIDLSLWQVKDMEWIKDCPVPQGEDFRRLPNLWTES